MKSQSYVFLPNNSCAVPRLGFGCAYLTAGWELKRSVRLVHVALDAGIRHFDVAPLYGIGTAEAVLGEALRAQRQLVTIASKVGRARPILTRKTQLVRFATAPIRRRFGSFIRRAERTASAPIEHLNSDFSINKVRASLDESLRQIRTDYIDILLLHEASDVDITDELLTFLDRTRCSGKIRATGIASDYTRLCSIDVSKRREFDVLQYSWDVFDAGRPEPIGSTFRILHRPLLTAYDRVKSLISTKEIARCIEGFDLADGERLSDALLAAALACNEDGMILFGTRDPQRLAHNFAVLKNEMLLNLGKALSAEVANYLRS